MPASPEKQLLRGIKVLITRPEHENSPLAKKLSELGAEVISHPVIRIAILPDPDQANDCLARLDEFATLAFLSRNAAIAFSVATSGFERPKSFPPIGAIGTGTKSSLQQRGYTVQFLPEHANSESMANSLIQRYRANGFSKPILILRADRGSEVLPQALDEAGVPFIELPIYRSVDVTDADASVLADLQAGEFDWLTVTSSAIASNSAKLFGDRIGSTKIVSISPKTSQAAREAGLTIAAEAKEYNLDGIVSAILLHQQSA